MKSISVKFCGGCNTRYDLKAAYEKLRTQLTGIAAVSFAKPEETYDALVIIRGCTGCPYLYEEITARERFICLSEDDISGIVQKIIALP